MTTQELERPGACIARLRSTPDGDVDLVPVAEGVSVYGPVEVAWYRDRLKIAALGAGPASITRVYTAGEAGQDVVVEIRLPSLDELPETVPGAD